MEKVQFPCQEKLKLLEFYLGALLTFVKQMYRIFALYCCFIAQYLKQTSLILYECLLNKRPHIALICEGLLTGLLYTERTPRVKHI